jgi:hypothetical protein
VSFSVGGEPRAVVRLAAADVDEEEAIDVVFLTAQGGHSVLTEISVRFLRFLNKFGFQKW